MRELNVAAETHGRVLVEEAPAGPLLLLAGFHGYGQNADEMMDMLRAVPVGRSWTRVSVQALHRFYRRSEVTVASWMTRQDRDTLIADNVQYVDAAIDAAAGARAIERLVLCGFSQGAAMAYRAAVLGARWPDAVIGVVRRRAARALRRGIAAHVAAGAARPRRTRRLLHGREDARQRSVTRPRRRARRNVHLRRRPRVDAGMRRSRRGRSLLRPAVRA